MNINTAPGVINRNTVNITPGYMSGFGNSFETEALPGALPRDVFRPVSSGRPIEGS